MIKTCVVCGNEFEARRTIQLCCSKPCSDTRRTTKNKFRRRNLARGKICVVCSTEFQPTFERRSAKTCSDECSYQRRKSWRDAYLPNYRTETREFIAAKNKKYYQSKRDERLKETAKVTAAMRLIRAMICEGIDILDPLSKDIPMCAVCGAPFQPRFYRRSYMLCGSNECHREWGRRAAEKRWRGRPLNHPMRNGAARIDYTEQQRNAWRRYATKKRLADPESSKSANRRSARKRAAAIKLVRELQTKGIEALL